MDSSHINAGSPPTQEAERSDPKKPPSEADEWYRSLVVSDLGGFIQWEISGRIKQANTTFLKMTGFAEADIKRGLDWLQITPAEWHEADHAAFSAMLSGVSTPLYAKELFGRNGCRIPVLVRSVMLPGSRTEGVSLVLDNSRGEQRRLQECQDAERLEAIGRLAGGVAHEFNNLLMIILSNVQLAQEQIQSGVGAGENLHEVVEACDRASDLTQQLLAFGRRQLQRLEECDVNEIAAEMLRFAHRVIGENLETELACDECCGVIRADRGQLKQILLNLLLHARDAMSAGGKIILKTNAHSSMGELGSQWQIPAGQYVKVEISDNGPGMADGVKARVFEPFFTTKELGKGSGLGLATVYGLVKQNNGFIQVASEIGRGTTFSMYFPAVEPSHESTAGAVEISNWTGSELILLVEDEDALRSALKRYLLSRGFRVLEARDGEEGCEVCAAVSERIDLILSDVVMPKMGGVEMVRRLRETHPDVPVIFMSGYTESPVCGGPTESLLPKPFNMNTLAAELHKRLAAGR